MTGPQGMGPMAPVSLGEYDLAIMTMGPIFYIMPLGTLPTFTAWESLADAAANDIGTEGQRGYVYFRAWLAESGNAINDYDTLIAALPNAFFEILPGSSLSTYTAWESRATAYSNNMSIETAQGLPYFRAWFNESGNSGNYDDHADDTEMGTIFKIEDNIT